MFTCGVTRKNRFFMKLSIYLRIYLLHATPKVLIPLLSSSARQFNYEIMKEIERKGYRLYCNFIVFDQMRNLSFHQSIRGNTRKRCIETTIVNHYLHDIK